MKMYAQLSAAEMEAVARLPPTKEEEVVTLFSDEGVFEVRGKLFKLGVVDADARVEEAGGRTFAVDPSVSTRKEVWQIPTPYTLERKIVLTHHLAEGLALIVEKRAGGATYFFTGGTVAQSAAWLNGQTGAR